MIFLVHHSRAVDSLVDPQRPLTPEGRSHAEELARRVHERGVKPDVIWHSGKLRARQTAEPFWRLCNPLAEFGAARGIQPDDPPDWIRDVVEADPRQIMIVGHMPHIARLHRALVAADAGTADFPLHGAVALERKHPEWVEVWREL